MEAKSVKGREKKRRTSKDGGVLSRTAPPLTRSKARTPAMGVKKPRRERKSNSVGFTAPGAPVKDTELLRTEQGWEETELPRDYRVLLQIFSGLVSFHRLNKNKRQLLSFADAKESVARTLSQQFSIKQLLQMIHLYPEGIECENIQTHASASASQKLVIHLRIPNGSHTCFDGDRALKREMRRRLVEMAAEAKGGEEPPEIPEAPLPDSSLANLRTRMGTPAYSPMRCSSHSVRRIRTSRVLFCDEDDQEMEGGCGPEVGVKRGGDALTPMSEGQEDQMEGVKIEKEAANRNTAEAGLGTSELGFALSPSMRKILAENKRNRDLMSPVSVKKRKTQAAIGVLVKTFDQVRAIFMRAGRNRQPLATVLAMLKKGLGGSSVPEKQVRLYLQQLLNHAPDFIRLEGAASTSESQGAVVMSEDMDIKETRMRLKQVAMER